MYTLYIDTHMVNLVIGLLVDGKLKIKKEIESKSHTENTVNLLSFVLEEAHINVDDLKEIIVINGPGSFTGVRIGVVIAKIIGYTKNITIKALSYLEAMALEFNNEVVLGVKDRNGAFIGHFDKNHELIEDYVYLANNELENKHNIVYDKNIDIEHIAEFMKDKESIMPHLLKPLYVKKIEVEKW